MIASCMLKLCSMFDKSSRLLSLIRSTYALRCFLSKCSIRDRHVLHKERSFFWYDETYKQSSCHSTFFSSCQCRRDISEIVNFCLTWIARNLRQWTNQLDENVSDFIVVIVWQWTNSNIESRRHCLTMNEFKHRESSSLLTLFQIFEYVSAQSSHESNSRIRALSILLYSSMITFDAHSKSSRKSFEELFSSFFLTWSSFEHELFAFRSLTWSSFEHELFASIEDFS